jgi:hypothetical protein
VRGDPGVVVCKGLLVWAHGARLLESTLARSLKTVDLILQHTNHAVLVEGLEISVRSVLVV